MELQDSDFIRNIGRNVGIGLAVAGSVTVGLCFWALGDLGHAASVAVVPALFAGPYIGLLMTLIAAVNPARAAAVPVPLREATPPGLADATAA